MEHGGGSYLSTYLRLQETTPQPQRKCCELKKLEDKKGDMASLPNGVWIQQDWIHSQQLLKLDQITIPIVSFLYLPKSIEPIIRPSVKHVAYLLLLLHNAISRAHSCMFSSILNSFEPVNSVIEGQHVRLSELGRTGCCCLRALLARKDHDRKIVLPSSFLPAVSI